MANQNIVMPSVTLTKVGHVAPECARSLSENDIGALAMTDTVLQDALRIKNLLGIVSDKYGGVDENDLLIIATA